MSKEYLMKRRLLEVLEKGEPVIRQCTCCGEEYEVYDIEVAMRLFTCIACWYDLEVHGAHKEAVAELRVRSCGPLVSQAVASRTEP